MLHGSEGGSFPALEPEAVILASQGFAVLVYCYFDCGRGLVGPRQTLKDVDVAAVHRAAEWLRAQPQSNGKVAVYGFSRGAELALVAASLDAAPERRLDAVAVHSPSDRYNSYFNWNWREPACLLCRAGQGNCRPDAPRSDFVWNIACGPDDEMRMDFSRAAWIVDGGAVRAGTRIEVERYQGPLLITVGESDEVWPVDQTRRIEATLRDYGREPEVHYFPGAGHIFGQRDENQRRAIVLAFLKRLP